MVHSDHDKDLCVKMVLCCFDDDDLSSADDMFLSGRELIPDDGVLEPGPPPKFVSPALRKTSILERARELQEREDATMTDSEPFPDNIAHRRNVAQDMDRLETFASYSPVSTSLSAEPLDLPSARICYDYTPLTKQGLDKLHEKLINSVNVGVPRSRSEGDVAMFRWKQAVL